VHGNVPVVAAAFHGLRAAVIAIVAAAVIRIGKQALRHPVFVALAAAAFIAIFFFKLPFPLIIIGAGLLGFAGGKVRPDIFRTRAHGEDNEDGNAAAPVIRDDAPPPAHTRPNLRRAIAVLAIGMAVWWLPLLAVGAVRGFDDVLMQEGFFFSRAAMVTFGGAYAVLAYIAQAAVEQYGWLEPHEMLDGLGLAESTPGPLIMVTEFVGFLGAFRNPGNLDPGLMGAFGATVTVWATFAPCFLWIFMGAPFIEQLRGNLLLNAALAAITAAVVGVILNLAVWLGLHTLSAVVEDRHIGPLTIPVPALAAIDLLVLLVAVIAFVGLWRLKWPVIPVVLGSAMAGLVARLLLGI
jgi:chromate transporter